MTNGLSVLEAQQNIHEMIARQRPLSETLMAIAEWTANVLPGSLASIMRHDPEKNTLSLLPCPYFTQFFIDQLQGVPVRPDTITSGAAAFERRLTVTEDLLEDVRYKGYRELFDQEGVRACWSTPILSTEDELLGTIDIYYRTPHLPTKDAEEKLERAASLAALAIRRNRESERHRALSEWHRALFNNHPHGVYTIDLEGQFRSCNSAFEKITGYPEPQLTGRHFNQFVTLDCREQTQEYFDRACHGETVTYETSATHSLGHIYHLEITNFPVIIEGQVVGVYGICRDISKRRRRDMELRQLKRGIEASPHGVLMTDALQPDMPIVYANPAFSTITGYSSEEVIGHNCRLLQGEETDSTDVDAIRNAIRDKVDIAVVLRNYRKDGSPFWNHLLISPVFDGAGNCTHFIGIQQDISKQKEQEEQIRFQATHDLITGLPNQSTFAETLEQALINGKGGSNSDWLVVMCLNLDGFKPINEGLGYQTGNAVLNTVSRRLESQAPCSSTVARLVGDEFGILLTGCTDSEEVKTLAKSILNSLAEPIEVDQQLIHLSASIGIACTRLAIDESHELMQYADLALQKAKRQGKNTWQWYEGHKTKSVRHTVALRHDLYKALEEEQLELHYQPLVDAVSGKIRSVEALVRWRHPFRGIVSPGEFIPLAEETGQIVPMGRWILKQACKEIAAFNAGNDRAIPVAVNISSLQFLRDGFLDDVTAALNEASLEPIFLELEVTESVLLDGAEPVIELMNTLKNMGIWVSLDDFGTGFSSLSYLRDLPVHKVKLDRSFVQNVDSEPRIAAIVQGVITMAHHMNMVVVAEGIETHEQQLDLARRHCDLLQGFYFARPMPLLELRKLPDTLPAYRN